MVKLLLLLCLFQVSEGAVPRLNLLDLGWVNAVSNHMAEQLSIQRPRVRVIDYYCDAYVGGINQSDL